jgi:hypothetical protein
VQFNSTTISQILVIGNTAISSGQGNSNRQPGYTFTLTAKAGFGRRECLWVSEVSGVQDDGMICGKICGKICGNRGKLTLALAMASALPQSAKADTIDNCGTGITSIPCGTIGLNTPDGNQTSETGYGKSAPITDQARIDTRQTCGHGREFANHIC